MLAMTSAVLPSAAASPSTCFTAEFDLKVVRIILLAAILLTVGASLRSLGTLGFPNSPFVLKVSILRHIFLKVPQSLIE